MTGGVTPRVARMGRSPAVGCGAAATSKPWGMRRVETRMVAPRRLQKHLPDALPPAVPPAWTQPGSSKDGVGRGIRDDSEFLQELYVEGFGWVALLRIQQTIFVCPKRSGVVDFVLVFLLCACGVWAGPGEGPFTLSLLGSLFVFVWGYEEQHLVRGRDIIRPSLHFLVYSHSDPDICLFQLLCPTPDPSPEFHPWLQPFPHNWTGREWPCIPRGKGRKGKSALCSF